MGELIVVAFKEPYMADALLTRLKEIDKATVLDIVDSAVIARDVDGTVNIDKALEPFGQFPASGAIYFGFVGGVFGWILSGASAGGALFGLQAGVILGWISGAVAGKVMRIGLPTELINDAADNVPAGASALCVLAGRPFTDERVLKELKKFDGVVLSTSLAPSDEAVLKKALLA
jgi:uncharacterized membrane protein